MIWRVALALCASLGLLFGTSSAVIAQQKTVKECRAEWQAQKAENQAKGVTETAYIRQCRSGNQQDTSSTATASPNPAAPAPAPRTRSAPSATASTGDNQYAAESQARAHCPTDTVVWANLPSKIYHFGGYRDYGNTKRGAYMCEGDALQQGFRAAKNEKHPS